MSKPFLVYLPESLYWQAKEFSRREGPPISFLVREGLKLALEKRRYQQDGGEVGGACARGDRDYVGRKKAPAPPRAKVTKGGW